MMRLVPFFSFLYGSQSTEQNKYKFHSNETKGVVCFNVHQYICRHRWPLLLHKLLWWAWLHISLTTVFQSSLQLKSHPGHRPQIFSEVDKTHLIQTQIIWMSWPTYNATPDINFASEDIINHWSGHYAYYLAKYVQLDQMVQFVIQHYKQRTVWEEPLQLIYTSKTNSKLD